MDWFAASLGNAQGEVEIGGHRYLLDSSLLRSRHVVGGRPTGMPMVVRSVRGKLGDSEDSLLFLGTRLHPVTKNFVLKAEFEVLSSADAGRQAGYGLVALDVLAQKDKGSRHRNMLAVGCYRMSRFDTYEFGARAVAGHVSHDACEHSTGRRLDPTRTFSALPMTDLPPVHERHLFCMEKTDSGFVCSVDGGGDGEHAVVSGTDFLSVQDPSALYVGIFVSGVLEVAISDLSLCVTPGTLCPTPEGEIRLSLPDYPFPRELVQVPAPPSRKPIDTDVLFSAPTGTPDGLGTQGDPLDFQTALLLAHPGSSVVLEDGTYLSKNSIVFPGYEVSAAKVHVRAEHPGCAIIDGSSLQAVVPVVTILGNGWRISGLTFQNGPSSGLLVCGSDNVIESCVARYNADTGILVCAFPGEERESWPSGNLVSHCESHDNCDPVRSNADGFGAKLRVGEGNRFLNCVSHHNIDDGFDLYAKSVLGPTGAVVLEECVAYANGHLSGEEPRRGGDCGTGFKLGGEHQSVDHLVTDCVAYGNDHKGFSSNSNKACVLINAMAWDNADGDGTREGFLPNDVPKKSPSRRRLLFVVPRLSGGGAERVIASLASMMAQTHEVTLVTVSKDNGVPGYGVTDDVRVVNLFDWALRGVTRRGDGLSHDPVGLLMGAVTAVGRNVRLGVAAAFFGLRGVRMGDGLPTKGDVTLLLEAQWLRELKRELDVDCSVSFLNSANWLNVASREKERCIVSVRSFLDGPFAPRECRNPRGRGRIAKACDGADVVVAVSRELADALKADFGLPERRVRTIENWVDVEAIQRLSGFPLADTVISQQLSNSGFVFVSTGRLTVKKGHWHVVRAFSRVVERHPDALLVILGRAGNGEEDASGLVRDAMRAFCLEGKVVIPGFMGNPHQLVGRCDAFVSASLNEGHPNAFLEAMALGLPVISSDCSSGPREILAPETDCHAKTCVPSIERYGILVPMCSGERLVREPLQPEEEHLAKAMLMLMEDDSLRERLREASVERARHFSRERFLDAWTEVIEHG